MLLLILLDLEFSLWLRIFFAMEVLGLINFYWIFLLVFRLLRTEPSYGFWQWLITICSCLTGLLLLLILEASLRIFSQMEFCLLVMPWDFFLLRTSYLSWFESLLLARDIFFPTQPASVITLDELVFIPFNLADQSLETSVQSLVIIFSLSYIDGSIYFGLSFPDFSLIF